MVNTMIVDSVSGVDNGSICELKLLVEHKKKQIYWQEKTNSG